MQPVMNKWTMKELPEDERPYERLEALGAKALSDAELLSIILRTGGRDHTSVDLARQVLSLSDKKLCGLHQCRMEELQQIRGIGRVKAIQLKALAELAIRMAKADAVYRYRINSPKSIAKIYMEEMRYLDKEHIKVVFLDTKNGILSDIYISIGTVNASLVDPREVFKEALTRGAVNIILLHNHPSGDPSPSSDDIDVTKRLVKAGEVIGIKVIDHLIIGDGTYLSMKERGLGLLN